MKRLRLCRTGAPVSGELPLVRFARIGGDDWVLFFLEGYAWLARVAGHKRLYHGMIYKWKFEF